MFGDTSGCHCWKEGDATGIQWEEVREAAKLLRCTEQPHDELSGSKCQSCPGGGEPRFQIVSFLGDNKYYNPEGRSARKQW